ncbi:MAG TPA: hypothetical protein VIM55_08150 [Mucilaginibacter sp.]
MPEVTIRYKKPETLKILKSLAKYLDFKVDTEKRKPQPLLDDILIPGNKSLDLPEMEKIFTGRNIDAKKLREEAWKRSM